MNIGERLKELQNRGFYMQITCIPNVYTGSNYDLYISRWSEDSAGWCEKRRSFETLENAVEFAESTAAEYEKESPIKEANDTDNSTTAEGVDASGL